MSVGAAPAARAPRERAAASARALPVASLYAVAAGLTVVVVGLAAANGGYFSSSWGWAALGFAWVVLLTLVLRRAIELTRLELGFVAALFAFDAWSAIAATWSSSPSVGAFAAERTLVYALAAAALVLVARRRVSHLLAAVFVGVVLVDVYALATRVLPDRVGSYDPTATYRLAAPLGYWNGLGIFSVIALFLGLGFVARARSLAVRTLAGLTLPLLLTTLYFTFSRGSWLALGLAAVVVLAYDRRRLQLLATVLPALAPAVAAVLLASRSHALTTQGAATGAVTHAGHTLAWRIAGLSIAAAVLGLAAGVVERRLKIGARVRASIGAALALGAVVAVAGALVAAGGPGHVVRKAWHSFTAAPVQVGTGGELNKRLFSLSSNGRIDLWRAAWHEAKANPVLGGGSGSYQQWWLAHRTSPLEVQNAHNLYAETLAELGPFGLALLLVGLAVPLAAALAARRHRLASFALGGYAAFLIHAAADWDWQLPAVVIAALGCGCALLAAARPERPAFRVRAGSRVAAAVVAAALLCGTFVVLVGNLELGRATGAADAGNWQRSAHYARVASRWMPWSSEPWRVVGEAELAQREFPAARRDLSRALRRDPQNWQLWYDLAAASSGLAARAELARAKALNPLSPEIAQGL